MMHTLENMGFLQMVVLSKQLLHGQILVELIRGLPKGALKSRFHAGLSHPRNCLKFMFTPSLHNHADARLIFHAIMQLFSFNSRFHALKYVQ